MLIQCPECYEEVEPHHNLCPECGEEIRGRKRKYENDTFYNEDEWTESDWGQDID